MTRPCWTVASTTSARDCARRLTARSSNCAATLDTPRSGPRPDGAKLLTRSVAASPGCRSTSPTTARSSICSRSNASSRDCFLSTVTPQASLLFRNPGTAQVPPVAPTGGSAIRNRYVRYRLPLTGSASNPCGVGAHPLRGRHPPLTGSGLNPCGGGGQPLQGSDCGPVLDVLGVAWWRGCQGLVAEPVRTM